MGNRMRLVVPSLLAVFVAGLAFFLHQRYKTGREPSPKMAFVGDSTQLKATEVVATLDEPAPKGVNTIWCASFLCAWKTLENDLAKEPPLLSGNPPLVDLLFAMWVDNAELLHPW